jgi:hypothetical protein
MPQAAAIRCWIFPGRRMHDQPVRDNEQPSHEESAIMPGQNHVVIGVHGLSSKPALEQHREDWIRSIREGLSRNFALDVAPEQIAFDLVYWADWLGRPALAEDLEPYVAATGAGPLPSYQQRWFDGALREALERIEDPINWVKASSEFDWVRQQTGLDTVGLAFLQRRLVDLGTYYSDAEKRAALRKRLADKLIAHETKRIMLVAHSMGSIVAYDVLRDLGDQRPALIVDHFVTLGSPLGLAYVLDRIRRENASVRSPSMVRRWTNLADRRDPVAFDVHLGDEYEANDRGIAVEDALILNGYVSPAGKRNHHKIFGYLRAPEFSQVLKNFI